MSKAVKTITKMNGATKHTIWIGRQCAMGDGPITAIPFVVAQVTGTRRKEKYYHEWCYPRDSQPRIQFLEEKKHGTPIGERQSRPREARFVLNDKSRITVDIKTKALNE